MTFGWPAPPLPAHNLPPPLLLSLLLFSIHNTREGRGILIKTSEENMSEYLFGCGPGWLPKKAAAIAREHGAMLVNYTDPGCKCGYGCASGECKSARRHWFAGPNLGSPFDARLAADVAAGIKAAGIKFT